MLPFRHSLNIFLARDMILYHLNTVNSHNHNKSFVLFLQLHIGVNIKYPRCFVAVETIEERKWEVTNIKPRFHLDSCTSYISSRFLFEIENNINSTTTIKRFRMNSLISLNTNHPSICQLCVSFS